MKPDPNTDVFNVSLFPKIVISQLYMQISFHPRYFLVDTVICIGVCLIKFHSLEYYTKQKKTRQSLKIALIICVSSELNWKLT